jgi:glycosyltransferase involved in cell wall biosynthesis
VATKHSGLLPEPAFSLPDDACRHIAVLGAIGPEKGARHVERMVESIRARALPLRVVVVGYTDRESRCQSDDKVLTVHGPYDVAHVEALLDHYRVSVVAFPGIWPETFGYTLSEAWRAGRAALVPPTGALAERVRAAGAGWTIDRWPDIDALLDQVVDVTAPKNRAMLAHTARLARQAADHAPDANDPTLRFYSTVVLRAPSPSATRAMLDLIRESAAQALASR